MAAALPRQRGSSSMSWLVSMVIMSAVGSALVVKIYKVLFGDILGPLAASAGNSLFYGTWTAITAALGLRGVQKVSRTLRPKEKEVGTHIENPLKRTRHK